MKLLDSSTRSPWLQELDLRFNTIGLSLTLAYSMAQNNQMDVNYWTTKYKEQLYREDLLKLNNTNTYPGLKEIYAQKNWNIIYIGK